MLKDKKSKLLFVINPVSGGKQKIDWESEIREYFKNKPHTIEILISTGKNDESSLQKLISTFQPNKVIAVGGDGTIKLVAEQLIDTSIDLGILPAGSANGLATDLGLPFGVTEALDIINDGVAKKIDLISLNDKEISIHLSDIGLNALLIKYYATNKEHGKWSYIKAILRALLQKQIMKVQLKMDGQTISRSAYMIVIANTRSYGTGAIINPDGIIYDGKFEIIIVKALSLIELLKMLLTHQPFDTNKIEVLQGEEITITTRHKAYFQIDGEYRGKVTTLKAKILPGVLSLLLPKGKEL